MIGVEQGILLAILLSLLDVVRRTYYPGDFVVGQGGAHELDYAPAAAGAKSRPGLMIFRVDAALFYANAARLTDDVKTVVEGALNPVRWLVLDCSLVVDVDCSAGLELTNLITYLHQRGAQFGLAHADDALLVTLRTEDVLDEVSPDHVFSTIDVVFDAWEAR